MTKDEALKLALEALDGLSEPYDVLKAQEAIREALAQPEQEPVAWITKNGKGWLRWHRPEDNEKNKDSIPLYTTPPHRKPLTSGEIYTAYITATNQTLRAQDERLAFAFARAIEAAHGIKVEA